MSGSPDYRVALDVYNGPLDLLLFLIKRDEVDIYDIPISRITEQYLEYVKIIEHVDPEAAGMFLVLAATLMEIKSRTLLPKPPVVEDDEELDDPRLELVRQLLEYKKFKDAARTLDDRAEEHAKKFPRKPVLPPDEEDEYELENLDVWNLFEAFNSLLKQIGVGEYKHKVGIDDTPISLHAEDILDSLERSGGQQRFSEVFAGRDRGEMIGLFLALLELIRQRRIRAKQDRPFAEIDIVLIDRTPLDEVPELDASQEEAEYSDRPFSLSPMQSEEELDAAMEESAGDDELDRIELTLNRMEAEEAATSHRHEEEDAADGTDDEEGNAVDAGDANAGEAAAPDGPGSPDASDASDEASARDAGGAIMSRSRESIPVAPGDAASPVVPRNGTEAEEAQLPTQPEESSHETQ